MTLIVLCGPVASVVLLFQLFQVKIRGITVVIDDSLAGSNSAGKTTASALQTEEELHSKIDVESSARAKVLTQVKSHLHATKSKSKSQHVRVARADSV